jgi:nucleotide-binding universal stress UspA family protein
MKTILVPTDFSEGSIQGLEFAASLAKKTRSALHIYHAAETSNYMYASDPLVIAPPAAIMMEGINDNLKKIGTTKLESLKKKSFLKGIKITALCEVTTNIYNSILDYGDKIKADYIIMGTRGTGNVKKIILGSTTERVVRFATRPVIVIPGKVQNMNMKNIVFASDFAKEAYHAFPLVKDFAAIFKAKITLLKINTMDQFSRTIDDKESILKFNKKFGGKYESVVYNDYMKETGILNYLNSSNADMVAMGTHGKRGLKRFFSEDVSGGIIRLAHRPILILNLKQFKNKSDIRN